MEGRGREGRTGGGEKREKGMGEGGEKRQLRE